jgi:hypothetical protein
MIAYLRKEWRLIGRNYEEILRDTIGRSDLFLLVAGIFERLLMLTQEAEPSHRR